MESDGFQIPCYKNCAAISKHGVLSTFKARAAKDGYLASAESVKGAPKKKTRTV